MTQIPSPADWQDLLHKIKDEIASLNAAEKTWLRDRLKTINNLQKALDELFRQADGAVACAACNGECCACGRHHITLTNLLAYLLEGAEPPVPDFSLGCPFLGRQGCLLPVSGRPYNCITFFCDRLEEQLDAGQAEQLRTLDRQLRAEYKRVAARHPGASLRGLWIASARLGDKPLLR